MKNYSNDKEKLRVHGSVWEVEIMSGALAFAWKLFCPAMSSAESLQEDLLMTGVLNTFSRENTITSGSGGMSLS